MSRYFLKDFPDSSALLFDLGTMSIPEVPQVNAHLHTPFSFSSFESIPEIFEQAVKEGVRILGINDFFTGDGFQIFHDEAMKHRIFPLFNFELVGLMQKEQYNRFRINDPVNPGRIYLSGKGVDFPFRLDELYGLQLQKSRFEIQLHTKEIVEHASRVLQELDPDLVLKFSEIRRKFARDFVTERHISRAVRSLIFEKYPDAHERRKILQKVFASDGIRSEISDFAGIENEIRSRFLKSGGRAFVEEVSAAFPPVTEVLQIIRNAGGIPCYSLLLDDEKDQCTEYEANKQILLNELLVNDIHCVEFLPFRNDPDIVKDYALFFREQDFLVLFGTAHSTPEAKPLKVCTRNGECLDAELAAINFEGACIIAAHQYLRARGKSGYITEQGNYQTGRLEEFAGLGRAIIHRFLGT
jgi:hypothetical protein